MHMTGARRDRPATCFLAVPACAVPQAAGLRGFRQDQGCDHPPTGVSDILCMGALQCDLKLSGLTARIPTFQPVDRTDAQLLKLRTIFVQRWAGRATLNVRQTEALLAPPSSAAVICSICSPLAAGDRPLVSYDQGGTGQSSQFSVISPRTRRNSSTLAVTNVAPAA